MACNVFTVVHLFCQSEITNMAANFIEFKANNYKRVIRKLFTQQTKDIYFTFPAGEKIGAHKALLSALSTVFEAMFSGYWEQSREVEILDASFGVFCDFVQYFYYNKAIIRTENVGELLYLANKYEILNLLSACSSFLLDFVTLDDVIDCINLACMFGLDALKTKCKEIICKNTTHVIGSDSFLQCDKNALFEVLSIKASTCPEKHIFDASIKWAQKQCNEQNIDAENAENIRRVLGNSFDLIRFGDMSMDEFSDRPSFHKNMFTVDEIFSFFGHVKNECTRYRPNTIFHFKECMASAIGNYNYNDTRFFISKNMRLTSFCLPKEVSYQLHGHDNCKKYKIRVIIAGTVTEHWIRRATIDGIECHEFNTPPICNANFFLKIDIGSRHVWPTPLFLVEVQKVGEVTLNAIGLSGSKITHGNSRSIITCFSALHFEECK